MKHFYNKVQMLLVALVAMFTFANPAQADEAPEFVDVYYYSGNLVQVALETPADKCYVYGEGTPIPEGLKVLDPADNEVAIAKAETWDMADHLNIELVATPTVTGEYKVYVPADIVGNANPLYAKFTVSEPEPLTFTITREENGDITITPSDDERLYFFNIFSDAINEQVGYDQGDEAGLKEDVEDGESITDPDLDLNSGEVTFTPSEWVAYWYEGAVEFTLGDYRLLVVEVKENGQGGYEVVGEATKFEFTVDELSHFVCVELVNDENEYELSKIVRNEVDYSEGIYVQLSSQSLSEVGSVTYSIQAYEMVEDTWQAAGEPVEGSLAPDSDASPAGNVWFAELPYKFYEDMYYTLTVTAADETVEYEIIGSYNDPAGISGLAIQNGIQTYNLAGVRARVAKGVNIVNGMKVILK